MTWRTRTVYEYDVVCDEDGCKTVHTVSFISSSVTKSTRRASARKRGWLLDEDGNATCPRCRKDELGCSEYADAKGFCLVHESPMGLLDDECRYKRKRDDEQGGR